VPNESSGSGRAFRAVGDGAVTVVGRMAMAIEEIVRNVLLDDDAYVIREARSAGRAVRATRG